MLHGRRIFLYVLIPIMVFTVGASYVRFMVLKDYLVAYEGTCNPATHRCFVGCNDDECTDTYHYALVTKYAPDVESECGTDITDCDAANQCNAGNKSCTILYCSEESGETCSTEETLTP